MEHGGSPREAAGSRGDISRTVYIASADALQGDPERDRLGHISLEQTHEITLATPTMTAMVVNASSLVMRGSRLPCIQLDTPKIFSERI
jgi:hypothetical protein